jgi:hypothetical protein
MRDWVPTFKPPMYPMFPLTQTNETDLFFGSDLPNLSTWEISMGFLAL